MSICRPGTAGMPAARVGWQHKSEQHATGRGCRLLRAQAVHGPCTNPIWPSIWCS
jgi:hypothetical protein